MPFDPRWFYVLIPLGIGGIFFTIGLMGLRRTAWPRRHGAKAHGEIVGHWTSRSDNGRKTYYPVIAWSTDGGAAQRTRSTTGQGTIGSTTVGSEVLVHYDSANPHRWTIDGYGQGFHWGFTVLGGIFVVATVVIVTLVLFSGNG